MSYINILPLHASVVHCTFLMANRFKASGVVSAMPVNCLTENRNLARDLGAENPQPRLTLFGATSRI